MKPPFIAILLGTGLASVTVFPATAGNWQAVPTPDGAYVSIRGSMAFMDDVKKGNGGAQLRASFDTGVGGSVAVGYITPWGVRLEAEGLYRYFKPKTITVTAGGATTVAATSGQVHMFAPMLNAIYDFKIQNWPVQPFVGAGIGAVYADVRSSGGVLPAAHNSSWGLGYQLMAGVAVPLTPYMTARVMYRFMSPQKLRFQNAAGTTLKTGPKVQSFDVGVDFRL